MRSVSRACIPLFLALSLAAADPTWATRPISSWTAEDARQVLAASPWVKRARLGILPQRSEDQMREGGKMGGGGKRAGLTGSDNAPPETLWVRWESAATVRAAEVLAGDTAAPEWEGGYYVIAIYDVPGITPAIQRTLRTEVKQTTSLKREGKKDIKPERVEIDLLGGKLARVVSFFPRSAALETSEGEIGFLCRIGRFQIAQQFQLGDMVFQGKPQL